MLRPQAEVGQAAAPLRAQHPQAVGVVHQQPGIRALGQGGQLRQGRQVPVHAEDPVRGDEPGPGPVQQRGQGPRVRMGVAPQPGPAEQGAVQQGGVVQAVLADLVPAPRQGGDDPQVGHVTGGEEQGPRSPGEVRQFFLQGLVRGAVAGDQVGRAAADAVGIRAPFEGGDYLRMVGQAQVVVAAEGEQAPPVDPGPRPLRTLEYPRRTVEMGRP